MEKLGLIFALSLLAVGFTNCSKDPNKTGSVEDFWSQCLEIKDLRTSPSVEAVLAQTAYSPLINFRTENSPNQANILTRSIWNKVKIPVCWEDPDPFGLVAVERETVRNAIERTWNSIFDGTSVPEDQRLEFVGWEECGAGNNGGIRIKVEDVGPYVTALGQLLMDRPSGMVLNFTFKNWSPDCSYEFNRLNCIDYIAVHEFGHALGMSHEQNRRDTPASCTEDPQGSNGDLYIGRWDLNSVMNYCSPQWNNSGRLTATDILGVRSIYAPYINKEFCDVFGDLVNQDLNEGQNSLEFTIDLHDDLKF